MKKRFLSMVLLLAFVFGMGVPVAAYDGGNDDAALDLQLVDFAGAEARPLPRTQRGFELLGRNEFALRRGFGNAKTLVTAHSRRAWRTED